MALTGHVRDFPLAELLFFLSSKHRTGQLVLKRPGTTITFTLRLGRLIAAQMLPADQRLGNRLVADGALLQLQLAEALHFQRQHAADRPLGTLLVERGYVDRERLLVVLREQIADCLVTFLMAPGGVFVFRERSVDSARIEVDVVVEREVLDAIRRADEEVARQIETGTLRLNAVMRAERLQPFIADNWDVIDAMLGGATTVDDIVAQTTWRHDRVMTTLYQLHTSGAIEHGSNVTGVTTVADPAWWTG